MPHTIEHYLESMEAHQREGRDWSSVDHADLLAWKEQRDDLLNVLRIASENMHRWTGTTGPRAVEFIEAARAAIAAAEGRTP